MLDELFKYSNKNYYWQDKEGSKENPFENPFQGHVQYYAFSSIFHIILIF